LPYHQVEKLYKEREKVLRELEHAEAVFDRSKRTGGDDGVRSMHRTGLLGCMGPKVDTIDYLQARSADLTDQFEEERKHVLQAKIAVTALVIFNNRRSAAQAGQVSSSISIWKFINQSSFGVSYLAELHSEEETQHRVSSCKTDALRTL